MSAPDVNIEKQKHRHRTMVRGVWIGVAIACVVAAGIWVGMGVFGADPTDLNTGAAAVSG